MKLLALVVLQRFLKPFVWREHFVFRPGDFRPHLLGLGPAFIQPQGFQPILDHAQLVVVVVNGKGAFIAQLFNIAPQDAYAHGVERAQPHIVRVFAHQLFHAFTHFPGGFIGKRQRQNMPGLHAGIHQVGDPVGKCSGFAAACTGQNQHRPVQRFRRLLLHRIESR